MKAPLRMVDLFAGWGGTTLGAEQAGHKVVWAANHWSLAVEAHSLNHPLVQHVVQDLKQANWTKLPPHDVMLASPACPGHSTASQPRRRKWHDESRATAMAVLDAAEVARPKAIMVENVPAFRRWEQYPRWHSWLESLGYNVSEHLVWATAHGVPQRRQRLFVVAIRKDQPGQFVYRPSVTGQEPAFGPAIDWGGPRSKKPRVPGVTPEHVWTHISVASAGVQRRSAAGRARFGRRFLGQHVTGHRGIPLTESIRTITTKDQWFVVDYPYYRPLTVKETARAMGFPDWYQWPAEATRGACMTGLGNAVPPPVARDLCNLLAEAIDPPTQTEVKALAAAGAERPTPPLGQLELVRVPTRAGR